MKSLTQALKGRTDVPDHGTAARWIREGIVSARGGGKGGKSNHYRIGAEEIYQLRVLWALHQYCNSKILRQIGHILQNRPPDFTGWLGVSEKGKVVIAPWDTKLGDVVDGEFIIQVINLNRMPKDSSEGEQGELKIPVVTPEV